MEETIMSKQESDEQIASKKKGVNLARIKLRVLRHFPSLKSAMKSRRTVDGGSGTPGGYAAVNNANIILNADWMRGASEEEQAATYAHELKHIENGDTARSWTMLFNIAADAVDNEELANGGLPVRNGVKIPDAVALGVDKLLDILTEMDAHIDGQNFTERDFNAAISGDTEAWNKGLQIIAPKPAIFEFDKFAKTGLKQSERQFERETA